MQKLPTDISPSSDFENTRRNNSKSDYLTIFEEIIFAREQFAYLSGKGTEDAIEQLEVVVVAEVNKNLSFNTN